MEAPAEPDVRPEGRFYRPGTHDEAVFVLERLDRKHYRIREQFEYVDHLGVVYTVPANVDFASNKTDMASVPLFLTWLVPKDGRHTPAALLHDALIGGTQGTDYLTSTGTQVDEAHADYVFREAMKDLGVEQVRRWLMWTAVALRTASHTQDGGEQKKRWIPIGVAAVATVALALVSAVMALDVPDLGTVELPWLGDRPWFTEIVAGVIQIAAGSSLFAIVLAVAFGGKRMLAVGVVGGAAIGFFGLPMVSAFVGYVGYLVLERVVGLFRQ